MDELSIRELRALRKSTDHLPIAGIDAMFIATLQIKLDNEIKSKETPSIPEKQTEKLKKNTKAK